MYFHSEEIESLYLKGAHNKQEYASSLKYWTICDHTSKTVEKHSRLVLNPFLEFFMEDK